MSETCGWKRCRSVPCVTWLKVPLCVSHWDLVCRFDDEGKHDRIKEGCGVDVKAHRSAVGTIEPTEPLAEASSEETNERITEREAELYP